MQLLLDSHLLAWELVSKQALGQPDFHVQPVLLRRAHHALPPLQRDPFARLPLAQASADGLLLITADQQLAAYPGPVRYMAAAPSSTT